MEEPQNEDNGKKKRSLADLSPLQAVIAVFIGVAVIALGETLIKLLLEMLRQGH